MEKITKHPVSQRNLGSQVYIFQIVMTIFSGTEVLTDNETKLMICFNDMLQDHLKPCSLSASLLCIQSI